MSLELTKVTYESTGELQVFDHVNRARDHIRNHLLTAPETEAWALISKLQEIVPGDFHSRKAAAKALEEFKAPSQALYDLYVTTIKTAINDSENGAWAVKKEGPKKVQLLLGFDGLLILAVGDTIRTAFIAGAGIAERTKESRSQKSAPLPREMGMRTRGKRRRKGHRRTEFSEKRRERREKKKERKARESKRTPTVTSQEEDIFEKVFLPAFDFVRDQNSYAFDMYGQAFTGGNDYGILNESLPKRRLRFADWEPLRRAARKSQ